ncbi:MAG: hypothetical protein SAqMacA_37520 [Shewanella algae]
MTFRARMARQSLQGRTRSESQDRLCESAPQVMSYIVAGSSANTHLGNFSQKPY